MLKISIISVIMCFLLASCATAKPAATTTQTSPAPPQTVEPVKNSADQASNTAPGSTPETPKAEAGKVSGISTNDLTFVISGKTFKAKDTIDTVISALGKGYAYSEAPSCDHDGVDKIFKYSGVEFNTFPDGSKDIINEIIITDTQHKTSRGIVVGNSKDDVIARYGSDYQKKGLALVYPGNGSSLWFYFKGNTVSSISLSAE